MKYLLVKAHVADTVTDAGAHRITAVMVADQYMLETCQRALGAIETHALVEAKVALRLYDVAFIRHTGSPFDDDAGETWKVASVPAPTGLFPSVTQVLEGIGSVEGAEEMGVDYVDACACDDSVWWSAACTVDGRVRTRGIEPRDLVPIFAPPPAPKFVTFTTDAGDEVMRGVAVVVVSETLLDKVRGLVGAASTEALESVGASDFASCQFYAKAPTPSQFGFVAGGPVDDSYVVGDAHPLLGEEPINVEQSTLYVLPDGTLRWVAIPRHYGDRDYVATPWIHVDKLHEALEEGP